MWEMYKLYLSGTRSRYDRSNCMWEMYKLYLSGTRSRYDRSNCMWKCISFICLELDLDLDMTGQTACGNV